MSDWFDREQHGWVSIVLIAELAAVVAAYFIWSTGFFDPLFERGDNPTGIARDISVEGDSDSTFIYTCEDAPVTGEVGQTLVWHDVLAVKLVELRATPGNPTISATLEVSQRGAWPEGWVQRPISVRTIALIDTGDLHANAFRSDATRVSLPSQGEPPATTLVSGTVPVMASGKAVGAGVVVHTGYVDDAGNEAWLCFTMPFEERGQS